MSRATSRRDKVLLRRIAVRRLKESRETVLLALGMLFSCLLVSFFLFFAVTVREGTTALAAGLPHIDFVRGAADGMNVAALLLTLATVLSIRTWAGLSADASAHTVTVLHSMGATAAQRRYLLWTELSMQYMLSLLVGTTVGAVGGTLTAHTLIGNPAVALFDLGIVYALLWMAILLGGWVILILCYTLPHLRIKGLTPSITESLRRRGHAVSTEVHSYRQSKTYRRQSFLNRLAKKSVDFYQTRYRSLALSLAVSVFYPLLAVLLLYHLLGASVTLDTNPFDGIDTMDAVMGSVMSLLAVVGLGFLLLTAQGIWGGSLLIRTQLAQRRQAGRAYLAMGMTERDFRRVTALELRSLLLRSGLYLLLFVLIANFCFLRIHLFG